MQNIHNVLPCAKSWMQARFFTLLIVGALSLNAHASLFSLEGIVEGSTEFSVTADGVTMTIFAPQPAVFSNYPDSFDVLDLGTIENLDNGLQRLDSFEIMFDQSVDVLSFTSLATIGTVEFSISGVGVNSQGNSVSCRSMLCTFDMTTQDFNSGPLRFNALESYLVQVTADEEFRFPPFPGFPPFPQQGSIIALGGIEASPVPLPGAAWMMASSIAALFGTRRKWAVSEKNTRN